MSRRKLKLGLHSYTSNWAVADCRYDVLLGMPCHKEKKPVVDYSIPSVYVGMKPLPLTRFLGDYIGLDPRPIRVTNLGVNRFRRLFRNKRKRKNFQVYQLVEKERLWADFRLSKESQRYPEPVKKLLVKYQSVFKEKLPSGLLPERAVDHAIEIDEAVRPPLRPLHQLSPAELVAVKEYLVDLLKNGKIRRSRSPFGASLFFSRKRETCALLSTTER